MQILGKRSKVLLIVIAIIMLISVGVSFAMWDNMSTANATSGDLSQYANAKVGDVITFGNYYQTGKRINNDENAEYEKTPIEWIVVDKDERTGQLTLMSKYILAAGSYFGNWYCNESGTNGHFYSNENIEIAKNPYNQAYVESTARAFLNNLERRDLGGDSYSTVEGFKTSVISSNGNGKLLASVGFSNRKHTFDNEYRRPIAKAEYRNRPASRGFYDEAFTNDEKAMIVPKVIPGYVGHRWPDDMHDPIKTSYIEGVIDKVWLPSATELNIMNNEDNYTNASDESNSTVFRYFNSLSGTALKEALETIRTPFVESNSKAMNYSIPVYKYQSTEINENIHITLNSTNIFWTRSPMSHNYYRVRTVINTGEINGNGTDNSTIGVRPCVILKY